MLDEEEKELRVTQPMPKGTEPAVETTTAPSGDDTTTTDAGVVQFVSGLLMMFTIFAL